MDLSNPPAVTALIVCEQLPLRLLSCYGERRFAMPGLDRLASRSHVFDRFHVFRPLTGRDDPSWWRSPVQADSGDPSQTRFGQTIDLRAEANWSQHVVDLIASPDSDHDSPIVRIQIDPFHELNELPPLTDLPLNDQLERIRELHVKVPEDLEQEIQHALTQFDQQIGALYSRITESQREVSLCLTANRGLPLGEQPEYTDGFALHSTLTHTPLLIHSSEHQVGGRVHELTQPDALVRWLHSPSLVRGDDPEVDRIDMSHSSVEQAVSVIDGREIAVRTNDFAYIRELATAPDEEHDQISEALYLLPEDRFERNDVSDQYPDPLANFREQVASNR